ncbi:MAG: S9 family peptidase [Chloroflexi bacterium]|nr:S9 family peptidase [Chloroflexota bacterium]MYD49544.1 S9 family peptidase [Chloroflexota bacterium]
MTTDHHLPPAPAAPRRPHTITTHGDARVDPWYWLREQEDPATMEYLRAENAYTEAFLSPLQPLQSAIYDEIRGRIKEDDNTVPEKEDEYYYYVRYEEGGQYPIHCRKQGSEDGPEEILLDVNKLAEGRDYTFLGSFANSPDHRLFAYGADFDGSEQFTIRVLDLETGETLPDTIPNTYYSLQWANDSRTFYYSVLDEHHRPVSIYRHTLGNDPADDELVYHEEDARFFVGVGKSNSRRFIYVVSGGNNMSEWRFLDANDPDALPTLIEPRSADFEYDVEDHDDRFFIRHNGNGARDFMLSTTDINAPGWEHWTEFMAHEPGRPLRGIHAYREHLVVSCRHNGLPQVMVLRLSDGDVHYIAGVDEDDFAMSPRSGWEFDTTSLRFSYTSMKTPASVFDYDMVSRQRVLRKQQEIPSGYDGDQYETRRIWATARDGTPVPISLLMQKGAPVDGSAPLYLYGYGSYGITMEAGFSISALSLVNRGFIYAIAHIRGGMEMGWDWYENGKLLNKRNTFNDFIDCAEHLVAEGYTSTGRIAAAGGSAGGMLMGAVVNARPDLFGCIVAHVPFVDVLNTMLDDTLPLTTMEYNEWGNPNDAQYYEYMRTYSPYDNVREQDYPPMLVTGGISDPRVTYWEPTKWVARLRATRTDDNPLLLKIHMDSGHAGASGRFERIKEVAEEYAFVLHAFGLSD